MSAFGISNAEALCQLARELGVGSATDVFHAAGRKTSPTYTRESAAIALKNYEDAGGRNLPVPVLNLCHDHQLFPSGTC